MREKHFVRNIGHSVLEGRHHVDTTFAQSIRNSDIDMMIHVEGKH